MTENTETAFSGEIERLRQEVADLEKRIKAKKRELLEKDYLARCARLSVSAAS